MILTKVNNLILVGPPCPALTMARSRDTTEEKKYNLCLEVRL